MSRRRAFAAASATTRSASSRTGPGSPANALRHNGAGVRLHVEVREGDGLFTMTTRNATKVSTTQPGVGLAGLSAQVRDAGGEIRFGPRDGEWLLSATLPTTTAVTRSRSDIHAA